LHVHSFDFFYDAQRASGYEVFAEGGDGPPPTVNAVISRVGRSFIPKGERMSNAGLPNLFIVPQGSEYAPQTGMLCGSFGVIVFIILYYPTPFGSIIGYLLSRFNK
jgi:hypothetical protein